MRRNRVPKACLPRSKISIASQSRTSMVNIQTGMTRRAQYPWRGRNSSKWVLGMEFMVVLMSAFTYPELFPSHLCSSFTHLLTPPFSVSTLSLNHSLASNRLSDHPITLTTRRVTPLVIAVLMTSKFPSISRTPIEWVPPLSKTTTFTIYQTVKTKQSTCSF